MDRSIRLEFLNKSHVTDLAVIANNEAISKTSGVPEECDEATVREWVRENTNELRTEIRFVVMVDNSVAGCCILRKVNMVERTAELAYWLGVDYWGQGIASSAAALLRDFAFEAFNLTALTAHFLKLSNGASGRILSKLGFVPDTEREDMAVADRFADLHPDVWTFVVLTRERWEFARESTGWAVVAAVG